MEINVSIRQENEPIAILQVKGDINASNFLQVIQKARELYDNPTRNLILDLSEVPSISSTGVAGIHKIALIYSGVAQDVEKDKNPDFTHVSAARKHIRLLNLQPAVDKTLEKSGMKLFFKVFKNLEDAINSF